MDNIIVNGIPLIAIIMGLVEFLKRLGITGKWSIVTSMLVGLFLGIGYQLSAKPPASFADWFGAIVFGLGLGLAASGLYDFVALRAPKVQTLEDSDMGNQ